MLDDGGLERWRSGEAVLMYTIGGGRMSGRFATVSSLRSTCKSILTVADVFLFLR
jgi:hypothetical protein